METKEKITQTIKTINGEAQMLMCQKSQYFYYDIMIIGAIVFIVLGIRVWNCEMQLPQNDDIVLSFVMKMVPIVILFVLLVWWMTFWGKRLDKSRDFMKEWCCKVRDCYGRLLDIELENIIKGEKSEPTKVLSDTQKKIQEKGKEVEELIKQIKEYEKLKDLLEEKQQLDKEKDQLINETKSLEQS